MEACHRQGRERGGLGPPLVSVCCLGLRVNKGAYKQLEVRLWGSPLYFWALHKDHRLYRQVTTKSGFERSHIQHGRGGMAMTKLGGDSVWVI